MDETNRPAQHNLLRGFELDRHSDTNLAKAFAELLANHPPPRPVLTGVQTRSAGHSLPQLQETL